VSKRLLGEEGGSYRPALPPQPLCFFSASHIAYKYSLRPLSPSISFILFILQPLHTPTSSYSNLFILQPLYTPTLYTYSPIHSHYHNICIDRYVPWFVFFFLHSCVDFSFLRLFITTLLDSPLDIFLSWFVLPLPSVDSANFLP
jgi:hypothetical protein